jgi:hypothetical protein
MDEYVPPSGYVASGTSQNASRTYATEGQKTIKVVAQDSGGLSSGWTTLSFDCAEAPEEEEDNQCTPPYVCHDNDLYQRTGPQCTDEIFVQTCSYFCSNGACVPPSEGEGSGNITATPSLVRTANTSTIRWTTSGMTECSVTEDNPTITDAWTDEDGEEQSSAITQKTVYTLTCSVEGGGQFTDSATVNIIPVFKEQ